MYDVGVLRVQACVDVRDVVEVDEQGDVAMFSAFQALKIATNVET